jgi:hypothetical protein
LAQSGHISFWLIAEILASAVFLPDWILADAPGLDYF